MGGKQSTLTISNEPGRRGYKSSTDLDSAARERARKVSQIKKISDIDESKFRAGFEFYSTSPKGLSISNFHEALALLEELGLRRLRDTPLGDLLFASFDVDGGGLVDENEFVSKAMIIAGTDQAEKIKLTFDAYAKKEDTIRVDDMVESLVQSWKLAFKILASKYSISVDETQIYAEDCAALIMKSVQDNDSAFRECVRMSLSPFLKIYNSVPVITREGFTNWASTDRTIKAKCGDECVAVAVTLFNIDAEVPL